MQEAILTYKEYPCGKKRKRISKTNEDTQKQTCNRNNFIPSNVLHLNNILFL